MSKPCPECRHILASGEKCHLIALRGRPFCYRHARTRTVAAQNLHLDQSLILPPIEDHASILIAINQILTALSTGRIDNKTAGRYMYGIQIASQTIRRMEQMPPIEPVTDYCDGICGDTVAVAEPDSNQPDPPLLSKEAKAAAIHGDPAWEPTNTDLYGRPRPEQDREQDQERDQEQHSEQDEEKNKKPCSREQGETADKVVVLKGRDFSRAEKVQQTRWASAPEGFRHPQ
jgi:hypothetical protein